MVTAGIVSLMVAPSVGDAMNWAAARDPFRVVESYRPQGVFFCIHRDRTPGPVARPIQETAFPFIEIGPGNPEQTHPIGGSRAVTQDRRSSARLGQPSRRIETRLAYQLACTLSVESRLLHA
jgi:hypothetical protein